MHFCWSQTSDVKIPLVDWNSSQALHMYSIVEHNRGIMKTNLSVKLTFLEGNCSNMKKNLSELDNWIEYSFPFPSPSDLSFALKDAFFAFIP